MKQTITLEPKEIEALKTIAGIRCEMVKCCDCPMDISKSGCMKILSKQTLNALHSKTATSLYGSMVQKEDFTYADTDSTHCVIPSDKIKGISVTTEDNSSVYKSPIRDNFETYPLSKQTTDIKECSDLTFDEQPRYSFISQMNDNEENKQ